MGDTLLNIRNNVRDEINDPEPQRVPSSSTTFTHDGGNNTAYFEDASENFITTHGVEIGMVIVNTSDGGSRAVIKNISNGGGTNARLEVESIEGGTDNDYDNGDVIKIYDRYAQHGLNNMKFTNAQVLRAINAARKTVATRRGGIEKTAITDILVMDKIPLVNVSGTFQAAEAVTGGTNGHTATIFYVGTDFIIVKNMITKVPVDNISGTFVAGETVTGGTNSYTGVVVAVGADYITLYNTTGEFEDDEQLTGGTSAATCDVNAASSYSDKLFAEGEQLTGGTSTATATVKEAYTTNNIHIGQDIPSDLMKTHKAYFYTGSQWRELEVKFIEEVTGGPQTSGDPRKVAEWEKKLWFWPRRSAKGVSLLLILYWAWPTALSSDTDTTTEPDEWQREYELEAAKILASRDNDAEMVARIRTELVDIANTLSMRKRRFGEQDHIIEDVPWDLLT